MATGVPHAPPEPGANDTDLFLVTGAAVEAGGCRGGGAAPLPLAPLPTEEAKLLALPRSVPAIGAALAGGADPVPGGGAPLTGVVPANGTINVLLALLTAALPGLATVLDMPLTCGDTRTPAEATPLTPLEVVPGGRAAPEQAMGNTLAAMGAGAPAGPAVPMAAATAGAPATGAPLVGTTGLVAGAHSPLQAFPLGAGAKEAT